MTDLSAYGIRPATVSLKIACNGVRVSACVEEQIESTAEADLGAST